MANSARYTQALPYYLEESRLALCAKIPHGVLSAEHCARALCLRRKHRGMHLSYSPALLLPHVPLS